MRCPNCASEVADGMRFCGACGHQLERRCPVCGTPAAPEQRFCGNCGSQLADAAAPARERRLVSVLFCDLVSFTTFSETRDFEDVRDVLDQYFAAARQVVAEYDGTIEKFIGDAVMAVWGAPFASENDAERAVRAGLRLTHEVGELSERLGIPELRVRVGVRTGEVAVQVGSAAEGMVTGDIVNTAARIQSVADPGTVFVGDTTRLACERAIAFEPAGDQTLKGKSAPVRVWRALYVRDEPDVMARSGTVEPPLVGRQDQLDRVSAALDALRDPGAGVRVLTVMGVAGIGKSRLGRELEQRFAGGSPVLWRRGRSLAFGEGNGLSSLAEIVRASAGITRADRAERERELVQDMILDLFPGDDAERRRVERGVMRLLDLDDRRALIEQGELFSAWRALFERLAADGPVVLVFEEAQLADQALLDFIVHLREWTQAAPLLVMVISRPEARLAPLAAMAEQIDLEPLSVGEMDALVTGVVQDAPEALLTAIRTDGGGIPLYAVETLRSLADRGVLVVEDSRYVVRGPVQDFAIPPTIRALVSSRLDRLRQVERQVLAAGGVLGESFTATAAAAIGGLDEPTARALLEGLVDKALLRYERDPLSPLHGRFAFLQGVVRRVTVARLPRKERKRLHLAAVDHLLQPGRTEAELAAVLAGHLVAAEEADPQAPDADSIRTRASATLRDAAERAASVGALTEALSLFDRAAQLAGDEQERAAILERAGTVAHRAGDETGAVERYRTAEQLYGAGGRDRDRQRARAEALRGEGYLRSPAELLPALRELEAELGEEPDPVKALLLNILAFALYQTGEYEEALRVASLAADTAEACGDQGELVQALNERGNALLELDRPEDAIAAGLRAVALAAEHDPRRVAPFSANLSVSLASVGRYQEAADRALDAISAARRGGERLFERYGRLVLGRALSSLGQWDQSIAEIEAVKDDLPPFYIGMAIAPLVAMALARGEHERVRELVQEHDRRCAESGVSPDEVDFRVLRAAALAIALDDNAAALAQLIPGAELADYAEWTGWVAPIVDQLVADPSDGPLDAARESLCGDGSRKQTPPVLAQVLRLEAHAAARAGETDPALLLWESAARMAGNCGLAFERAVITLEAAEFAVQSGVQGRDGGVGEVRDTFRGLGAVPWLERADRLDALLPRGA